MKCNFLKKKKKKHSNTLHMMLWAEFLLSFSKRGQSIPSYCKSYEGLLNILLKSLWICGFLLVNDGINCINYLFLWHMKSVCVRIERKVVLWWRVVSGLSAFALFSVMWDYVIHREKNKDWRLARGFVHSRDM